MIKYANLILKSCDTYQTGEHNLEQFRESLMPRLGIHKLQFIP
jgi:hypothetical protein